MLKRTVVPYYGKKNQRLEALGREALKQGNSEAASALFGRSKNLYEKRRKAARG